MSADTELRSCLLQAVQTLTKGLSSMVQDGRKAIEASPSINDFVKSRGSDDPHGLMCVYPVNLYVACLRTAGVKSRRELESLWAGMFSDVEVQENVEELLAAEEKWVGLISELDQEMKSYEEKTALDVIDVGEKFPMDIALVETKSGDTVSLKSCVEKTPYTLFILRKHYV